MVSTASPSSNATAADVKRRRPKSAVRGMLEDFRQTVIARGPVPLRMFGQRLPGTFGILMYHRVAPRRRGVSFPTSNVTPDCFRAQIAGLLKLGYQPWHLRKVLQHCREGQVIPRNAFVVTFDDGYANNYTEAWPVLRELQVPATIFVSTAYLDTDQPFPFEDWDAAGSAEVDRDDWRPLTTAECREMLDSGLIDLGSHTHTHADFRGRPDALQQELLQSLDVLKARFGLDDATFAYPFGKRQAGFSGALLAGAARGAGLLCALTSENEMASPQVDCYDWGRFTAAQYDTAATLAAKLDGWYSVARDAWRWLRRGK